MDDRQDLASKTQLIRELVNVSRIDLYWRRFPPMGLFSRLSTDSGLQDARCVELIAIRNGEITSDVGVNGRDVTGVFLVQPCWITCHDPRPLAWPTWENKVIIGDGDRWSLGRQWGRDDTREQYQQLVRLFEAQDTDAPDLVLSEREQALIRRCLGKHLKRG